MKKKLILVTSPPASGKTFVSMKLAEALRHVVYLDKDTLIPLSKRVFAVAGEEINRSSAFFYRNIRDYEYETVLALAMEAITYDDIVLINAPFTREVHDAAYLSALRARLAQKDAALVVVWVQTDPEICRQRMVARNSDRDTWKIAHWDEYVKTVRFDIPDTLRDASLGVELLVFKNSDEAEFTESLARVKAVLESGTDAP